VVRPDVDPDVEDRPDKRSLASQAQAEFKRPAFEGRPNRLPAAGPPSARHPPGAEPGWGAPGWLPPARLWG